MILKEIHLKNFGKFREQSFVFSSGINLVHGPNEAGKSTLMEAVAAALFGARDKKRLLSWGHEGSCTLELIFEEPQGGGLELHRELSSDRVRLARKGPDGVVLFSFDGKVPPLGRSAEKLRYQELLREHFGLEDEDLFRASCFLGQGELIPEGAAGLSQKLKALLSGFLEVDYDRVLESLQGDYFGITRANPWGKDKSRPRDLEEVQGRLEALKEAWQQAAGSSRELDGLQQRAQALQQERQSRKQELEQGRRYIERVHRLWQMQERQQGMEKELEQLRMEMEKVKGLLGERDGLMGRLQESGVPEGLPEIFDELLDEVEEVQRELLGCQKEQVGLRAILTRPLVAGRKPALAALALASAGALLAWWMPRQGAMLLLPSLALAAGIGLWAALRRRSALREYRRKKARYDELEAERELRQQRLALFDDQLERCGLSPLASEAGSLKSLAQSCRPLWRRIAELDAALDVLRDPELLGRQMERLESELEEVRTIRQQEGLVAGPRDLRPEDLPDAREKLAALEEEVGALERQLLELGSREAALRAAMRDLSTLEEEGTRLKEQEEQLWQRKEALALGFDLLQQAVEEFRKTYLERFAGLVFEHLCLLCPGRFEQLHLREDLGIELGLEDGSRHSAQEFSRGTRDALYLALRLALADHLGRGLKLPFLLDDPLVNLDAGRTEKCFGALKTVAEQRQILLFSHSDGLLRRAGREKWHLITLGQRSTKPPKTQEREDHVRQLHLL